jgi:hypothetical protein
MSALSRRNLVASAAALPALAVPALAGGEFSPSEPDPIFAAIERCEAACAAEEAAFDVRSDAQSAFQDRHGSLKPSGLVREAGEFFEKETGVINAYWSLRKHKQITKIPRDHWLAARLPNRHGSQKLTPFSSAKEVADSDMTAPIASALLASKESKDDRSRSPSLFGVRFFIFAPDELLVPEPCSTRPLAD